MTFFPLINIFFLILIYRVHRRIFWVTTALEVMLFLGGVWYIEMTYRLASNQVLYYLTLTGVGLVIGVAGFFLAISLNHKDLYEDLETNHE